MISSPSVVPRPSLAVAAVLCALAVGCKHKIGDSCTTGLDCDPEGRRTCDIAQPGGYCTVDGCTATSCPGGSACIRFFPRQYLGDACAIAEECGAGELCLPEGRCAPLDAERRYCMRTCGSGGDCRSGYECRTAGTAGSVALVNDPTKVVRYCAARDKRVVVDAAAPPDALRHFDAPPDAPEDGASDDAATDAPPGDDSGGDASDDVPAAVDAIDP